MPAVEAILCRVAQAPVKIAAVILIAWTMVGGGLYSLVEADASWIDGMYWVTVVMPTVGFGDFSPHTLAGRILYVITVTIGFLSTLILGGAFGAAILQYRYRVPHERTAEIDDDLCAIQQMARSIDEECTRLIAVTDHEEVKAALRSVYNRKAMP